jgi:D-aminopeptidase
LTVNSKESNETQKAVDALFARWNRSDSPGYLVGIVRGDELLYRGAFGLASLEQGVANTTATRMRIGSTTKQFTCFAIYLLQETGKLDVDASVRSYLPELPRTAVEPTLRQLMNHTGGYRDYLDLGMLVQGMSLPRPGSMLDAAVRQRDVSFAPGERMIYNNGGYHLLSRIVERVGGMQFGDFLKTHIFDPLGMIDTALVPDDMHIQDRIATCHVPTPKGGYQRGVFPSWEVLGEGGMVSTIDDMLRWLKHLRGEKRVGNAETWRQMTQRTRFDGDVTGEYASGLMISNHRGVEVVHHGGTVIGGGAQMLTVPAHDLDIILITNGSLTVDPTLLGKNLIDAILGDSILKEATVSAADAAAFPSLEGFYVSDETKQVYEVTSMDGKLFLREMMGPPLALLGDGDTLHMNPVILGPKTLHCANLPSLDVVQCGKPLRFTRIGVQDVVLSDIAAQLEGDYECADLAAQASIALNGSELTLSMQGFDGRARYRLEPLTSAIMRFVPADKYSIQSGIVFLDVVDEVSQRFSLGDFANRHLEFVRLPGSTARAHVQEEKLGAMQL